MSRASRAIHSFHRLSGAGERPTLKAEQGETNRTNLADVQSKVVLDPRDSGSVAGSPTKVRDDHLSFSINRRAWGDGTQSVVSIPVSARGSLHGQLLPLRPDR